MRIPVFAQQVADDGETLSKCRLVAKRKQALPIL